MGRLAVDAPVSWKPKLSDLELIAAHAVAKADITVTARALGIEELELVLFLMRLERGRNYTPPIEPVEAPPVFTAPRS
jgi:hypothetical protein